MNSDDQNPAVEGTTPLSETEGPVSDSSCQTAYRGNGTVARLPKSIRDKINNWLLDGVSYPDIIGRLGDQGNHLKPDHIYQWKKRGHKDWLIHQDWLAERRARQESAADLIHDSDVTEVNQGALQLGTLYIYDALRDLRSGSLDDKLGGDSAAFARLLNALSRASRETLQLQKYRDACARARAALHELKDPKRKLSESETRAIVLKVDDILGLRRPDDLSDLALAPEPPVSSTHAA
jgi:hypothetical protein